MKNRILFINNSSKLGIGTTTVLLQIIEYIFKNYEVTVVSDKHSNQLPDSLTRLQVSHYALHDRVVLYLPELVSLIIRKNIDLIYANGSNERSRGAFWAAKLTGKRFIWHIHESLEESTYAKTFKYADLVIANSQDTAERIKNFADVPKPLIIPNGIDINEFNKDRLIAREYLGKQLSLKQGWTRIINVGTICPRKNQTDIVEVASKVIARFPNTYFILVGGIEQSYYMELISKIDEYGLQQVFKICNYVSNIPDFICGSDLMLHTSKREPQGLVILEAMAARIPVIAYKVGGISESIINEKTGFLVPLGDVAGIVDTIIKLIVNPEQQQQMGNAGYEFVKDHYAIQNTLQKIKQAIENVL